ncbi:MAG TPA: hypothetical protein VFX70_09080 [Mycobacteriales bacterium]|nr:hypothetical protein [Mycobacteriales bacterium]
MGVGKYDRVGVARRGGGSGAGLWREVNARFGPGAVAGRYTALARLRAGRADPATFAASAREDVARLATALNGVLRLHVPDQRQRCQACAAGPFLVEWPCRTRRAVDHGLIHGWPVPPTGPDVPSNLDSLTDPTDPAAGPGVHEGFALAVLAIHDILPAAGGHPACCRSCLIPPDRCPVWALADGFLGITWSDPAQPAGAAPLA